MKLGKDSPRIGIFGGGQLGRMTALAASRLGLKTLIFSDVDDSPAVQVAADAIIGPYEDPKLLQAFVESCDVITYEFENIPLKAVEAAERAGKLNPSSLVLKTSQDRILEKQFIREAGLPTAPFKVVTSLSELEEAVREIGFPCVLKTARFGYDGKGQAIIRKAEDVAASWQTLKTPRAILEAFIEFEFEASVIVARSKSGEVKAYPLALNHHADHILKTTTVPAPVAPEIEARAQEIALSLTRRLNVVGLLAVEMFVTKGGDILINETAPRPHNSGHWTMDGALTCQFEQLVRAILDWPLGETTILHPTRMENLIGDEILKAAEYLKDPRARLHLYGKTEARPGRKMGHVNFWEI